MNELISIASTWNKEAQSFQPAKRFAKFLKGPVPWDWIIKASKLSGTAVLVGLAVWRLAGATKSKTVRLANSETEALGVDRNAKSRALRALETAGLVTVKRLPGRIPEITVIEVG